ncbi:MAG: putative oxidoreductase subunit protein, partial [Rhodospirillales bacterium]|nr:putative oxidoreductase subunit protein [Rhodospirillales bacterium]
LKSAPLLDSWIRIGGDGHVTVFTGKVELGQGIRTALLQVAADELDIAPSAIELVTADTATTPDEGVTAGSHSMQDSGTAIRNAAANVRLLLTETAARSWNVAPGDVSTGGDGSLRGPDGRTVSYGEIAGTVTLHVEARPDAPLRNPATYRAVGRDLPRIDIPAKLTGGAAYVQDMRLPGMLHARVLRGPSFGTRLQLDPGTALPDGARLIRDGGFAAVVAEREWSAIGALQALQAAGWSRTAPALPQEDLPTLLKRIPSLDNVVLDSRATAPAAARTVSARYSRPWLLHGSIGPSCAVARFDGGVMTVWTHSQGVFGLQRSLVDLLRLPSDKVRCIHVEGSGCYGHNGADDVAADAALVARAMPGRPIRMQWMREQEHGWEPLGTAMLAELEASLDGDGRIVAWRHEVWSNSHNARPVSAGGLLAGAELDPPFPVQQDKPIPLPEGGGDRNAYPLYQVPNAYVLHHFLQVKPLRVSALRSLGAHMNVFAIECMLDELARAGTLDPVALRLAHLADTRAREVVELAATRFGWAQRARGNGRSGCGFAFARYKNLGAYCAVALEIEVDRESGRISTRRAVAAIDSGQAVSPDGIRNQTEGGLLQSLSWANFEAMNFDAERRTGFDWSSYPILRFADLPATIEVHVIDRPGQPFLGTGEAAQGPASAALANALADATGVRLREMPLTASRVKAAIGVT